MDAFLLEAPWQGSLYDFLVAIGFLCCWIREHCQMRIHFQVHTEGKLFRPQDAVAEMRREVAKALTAAAWAITREIKIAAPVGATGYLRRSFLVIPARPSDGASMAALIVSPAEYTLPVELGRRPAWVPIPPLELWVRRKLGIPEGESRQVAFLISRKKSRERTPGKHFIEKSWEKVIPVVQAQYFTPLGATLVGVLS